tara:strand:+ start:453 stop:716 length:264 start_codon:yes stop_codon:yes gene_type:complete
MKLKEFMERVGSTQTAKVVRYLKDAMEQVQLDNPDFIGHEVKDITPGQRRYLFPEEMVKLLKVSVEVDSKYEAIDRLIGEPKKEDIS